MQSDAIRLLTVAIAVSVSQDEVAFEMLQRDYIQGFERYYKERALERRRAGEKNDPVYLDEMINYAVKELPIRFPGCRSLSELYSEQKKTEIKHRFISENVSQMLTRLAKRETIKQTVRQNLHGQDKQKNHAAIDSTKFDAIFTDFMVMFEQSCAASFRFEGDFIAYVMYSWINYYYAGRKIDIWRTLRDVDYAKREAETAVTEVKHINNAKKDNLPIHDLVLNIVAVNDLMFSHSGQSEGARGVCYDFYYLILDHLCSQHVERFNAKIREVRQEEVNYDKVELFLVDELDRREPRENLPANTSIARKIMNAKELVVYLFECVRKGEWNLDNISEIRDQAFRKGKRDRDGKNCVWKDVEKNAETARYFDREIKSTAHNYWAFDLLLKGVLSVYTLMTALEERGASLVETYPTLVKVFRDKRLARTVSTLEDLEYVDLMEQLLNAPTEKNDGELLLFDQMIPTYAGSTLNNHGHISSYRDQAILRGLLDNPQLKQHGNMQTQFAKLQSVADFMTAVPISYIQYVYYLLGQQDNPACFGPQAILASSDVAKGRHQNLYANRFLLRRPEVAEYYLYHVATKKAAMDSFEWHVGTAMTPCLLLEKVVGYNGDQPLIEQTYCMYVTMTDRFLLCPMDELSEGVRKLPSGNIYELQRDVANYVYNGQVNAFLSISFEPNPKTIMTPLSRQANTYGDNREHALSNSLGFDSYIGFENLLNSNVQTPLSRIKVFSKYQSSTQRYIRWMGEISLLQHSLIDLIQTMYSYGMFLALSSSGVENRIMERNGRILADSLIRSEFSEENLTWFFSALEPMLGTNRLQKLNFRWSAAPQRNINFVPLDMSCMDIIKGTKLPKCEKDTFTYDLLKALEPYSTPAQRFVQMYNFISVRLNFLRLLRDAYSLTFSVITMNLSALGCEYNSQFGIGETLEQAKMALGTGGLMDIKYALLDSIPSEDMAHFIGEVRLGSWQNFSVLCEDLLSYFDTCRNEITSLVDYEIANSREVQSEFAEFGSVFFATGPYSDKFAVDLFKDIRPQAKTDSAGFIIMKNSYFRGVSGNSEFYIHITGRMLESLNGKLTPRIFDFSNDRDCRLYRDIVNDAKNRNVW